MKNTSVKKRIIAAVLSAITIVSNGAIATCSASAMARSYPHQNYRGQGINNVRVADTTPKAGSPVSFFWP